MDERRRSVRLSNLPAAKRVQLVCACTKRLIASGKTSG